MVKIAPAVLMVDYGCLAEEILAVEKEADLFQFDVMDALFMEGTVHPREGLLDESIQKSERREIQSCAIGAN